MLALAIPMVIFYAISIVIGLIFQKRKLRREAAEDAAA
jgi:Sec-independent protein secretion pathway component TatC